MKKIVVMVLSVFMLVYLFPISIQAISDESNIGTNANTSEAMEIVYGSDGLGNARSWRVVSYDTNGASALAESGIITLLAKSSFGEAVRFCYWYPWFNNYGTNGSVAQSNLKTAIESSTIFTTGEDGAIQPVTLIGGSANNTQDGMFGDNVENAKLWALSVSEANSVDNGLRNINAPWSLRSPGNNGENFAYVSSSNGNIIAYGYHVSAVCNVRPALKLKLDSILFTSAAVSGKANSATASKSLSAVICDSNGAIKYYGKIADIDASGKVTEASLTLPVTLDRNHILKVFAEEINGDNLTDYASSFKTVNVITGIQVNSATHKISYHVGDSLDISNLTINATKADGTNETVNVTSDMVTSFDSTSASAKQTLTITYEGKTTTYDVEIKAVTPMLTDYEIISKANETFNKSNNEGITIISNGDFDKFVDIEVDDVKVDKDHYSVVSGSTVVTLKAEYLKTLSIGKHTLKLNYTDGSVDTTFTIVGSAQVSSSAKTNETPQTGDRSNANFWIMLLMISVSGIWFRKKMTVQ